LHKRILHLIPIAIDTNWPCFGIKEVSHKKFWPKTNALFMRLKGAR